MAVPGGDLKWDGMLRAMMLDVHQVRQTYMILAHFLASLEFLNLKLFPLIKIA